jgi:hypothetical protein
MCLICKKGGPGGLVKALQRIGEYLERPLPSLHSRPQVPDLIRGQIGPRPGRYSEEAHCGSRRIGMVPENVPSQPQ